ncbi:MAG: energy transducer TonB [Bacteroidetes bacterium]|nr:energy transducer TonB [Bacteroidota bacterium]
MNKLLLIIFINFAYYISFSQTTPKVDSVVVYPDTSKGEDDPRVFTKAEKSPEFPNGINAWKDFLIKNLDGNTAAKYGAAVGTYQVIIRFIIGKDGSLRDFNAETNFGFGMEQEVIRVLKLSPKWIPAMQNGYKVNFYLQLPITFVVTAK